MTRVPVACVAALMLLAGSAAPAAAQWPTVMMFYGGTMKAPVFVTGADTPAFSSLSGVARSAASAKDMGDRPYINVAYFWGTRDRPANNSVTTLTDLKPEMTWQHGRYYPAAAGKPAMLFVLSMALIKKTNMAGLPVSERGTPHPPGQVVPTDPAAFSSGGEVPAGALAVLKRLGVPTDVTR